MTVRLTTLSENTAGMGDFLAEWGLSILIEMEGCKILLDTGTGNSTIHNAETLDIDLSQIDRIVLSHGHNDHTGGLRQVLRRMKKEIEIIAHPDIWQVKYDRRKGKPERYIGIPYTQAELESLGARFHLTKQSVPITDHILTTGEVPMVTEYESIDSALFVKQGSSFIPDLVLDDQAIVLKTATGLVIILGCAHRGMINTIYRAKKITGVSEINTVVGGSHLIGASEERLWQTIAALKDLNVKKLGLCHCTDLPVISILAHEFGQDFIFNKSGSRLEIT